MIFVSMVIDAAPGQRDRLNAGLIEMMAETRREAGCVVYTYAQDLETPDRFHLSEMWESMEAMEAHIDAPHASKLIALLKAVARISSVKAFDGDVHKVRVREPRSE